MHLFAIAAACYLINVFDGNGMPVAGARATFADAAGRTDMERTDAVGRAAPQPGFSPTRVTVAASGFLPVSALVVACRPTTVVLNQDVRVAGVVRVATGTPVDLHSLPVPASILDAHAISTTPAIAADGLLHALAGADYTRSNSAFTNYGQLRASFDGAGQNRGLVLVDGIPAQDGFGGQIDWAAYPAGDLAGAALLRGAGSAFFGAGAVGGVLGLFTYAPPPAGFQPEGRASATVGTHGTDAASFQLRSAIGRAITASLYADDWRSSYFDFPPDFRSGVDFAAAQSAKSAEHLRVKFYGGPSTWELGSLVSADQQQQGRPNYWMTRRLAQFDGAYTVLSPQSVIQIRAYTRDGFVVNAADKFPTAPGVARYVQNVPTVDGGVAFSWAVTNDDGAFQFRLDRRSVRGSTYQYLPGGALQNSGGGAQWLGGAMLQQTIRRPRFELLMGARVDQVTSYSLTMVSPGAKAGTYVTVNPPDAGYSAISPRAALRYDLSPAVAMRASSGAGFRSPYLNELIRGFQIGAVVFAPEPSLVPERGRTYGAGIDSLIGRGRLSLDFSTTLVRDAIAFVTLSPTLQRRANVAQTQTDGATLVYAQTIGPCTTVRASGTTQYARVTSGPAAISGTRLAFVPDRSADVSVDSSIGRIGFSVDATYLGQTFADDLNTQPLGTALVAGFTVRAPLSSGAALTLTGTNVTNRTYLTSQDRMAPPAIVTLGVSLPLGHISHLAGGRCRETDARS